MDSVTVIAAGAVELSVTVPVELLPPVTPAGKRVSEETSTGGVTVITPTALPEFAVAVMFAAVFAVTAVVVIVKFALIAPAATVTVAGTLATAALLLESETESAELGALVRFTVPVEVKPPTCELGEIVTVEGLGDPPGGINGDAHALAPRAAMTNTHPETRTRVILDVVAFEDIIAHFFSRIGASVTSFLQFTKRQTIAIGANKDIGDITIFS